jgi:hypothetical protein
MGKTVTIDGQKVSAYNAILWATNMFGQDAISVDHSFPGWHWTFTFKEPREATLFALTWAK